MSVSPPLLPLTGRSILLEPERVPLRPSASVEALGRALVVAPHPDDESLGCGGLLALLAGAGLSPEVAFVTDGAQSHPNSPSYPPARLQAVREAEALDALHHLGLPAAAAHFLRHPDSGLPIRGTAAFADAVQETAALLRRLRPDTVLVAWRRDPHCDHEGAWHLFRAAVALLDAEEKPRWLEYPVWAWAHASTDRAPRASDGQAWRLDVAGVLDRKRAAIDAHRSQLGLITDDPGGFTLPADFLPLFLRPWELFIEPDAAHA